MMGKISVDKVKICPICGMKIDRVYHDIPSIEHRGEYEPEMKIIIFPFRKKKFIGKTKDGKPVWWDQGIKWMVAWYNKYGKPSFRGGLGFKTKDDAIKFCQYHNLPYKLKKPDKGIER